METLPTVFASGWASGINAYLAVLVLGIAERMGQLSQIPDVLASWPVLAIAAVLYAVEFVADKIPWVDSTWDAISTVIRPVVGAALGVLLAGQDQSVNQILAGVVGGGSALTSHVVKSGSRLAINTSPEPLSNIAASLVGDAAVLGVTWLAVVHPVPAAIIAGVLLVLGLLLLVVLIGVIRRRLAFLRPTSPPA